MHMHSIDSNTTTVYLPNEILYDFNSIIDSTTFISSIHKFSQQSDEIEKTCLDYVYSLTFSYNNALQSKQKQKQKQK